MSIHDDYAAIINTATDVPVILADQNGPRPAKEYITIKLMPGRASKPHRGSVDDEGMQAVAAHRSVSVQLQVYGPRGWDIAEHLSLRLFSEEIVTLLDELNITFEGDPRIQDIPELIDNHTYEPRVIVEFESVYTRSILDDVGFIHTVEGTIGTEPPGSGPLPFIAQVVVTQTP